jgi:hypothetical protein
VPALKDSILMCSVDGRKNWKEICGLDINLNLEFGANALNTGDDSNLTKNGPCFVW